MVKEYIPHIVKDGSREHVISYIGTVIGPYEHCNEPNCEVNKRWDEYQAMDRKEILKQMVSKNAKHYSS